MSVPPSHVKKAVVGLLLETAKSSSPEGFRAFFTGAIIANVVGNLPDEYWREFLQVKICDEPGCDCYRTQQILVEALDAVRDDHHKTLGGKQ